LESVLAILFFALFFGGFGWFIWHQLRNDRRRRAELDARAASQGWTLTRDTEGRRSITTVVDPGATWRLRLASGYSTGSSGSKSRGSVSGYSEFLMPLAVWPRGAAVFSQRMPGGMDRVVAGAPLVGLLQTRVVKGMLSRIVPPELLENVAQLSSFEAPPGIELSILGTEDPRGLDLRALHAAIQEWQPRIQRRVGAPAVILGPEGLRYRLPDQLHEAEDIASFIAQGQELAQRLSG